MLERPSYGAGPAGVKAAQCALLCAAFNHCSPRVLAAIIAYLLWAAGCGTQKQCAKAAGASLSYVTALATMDDNGRWRVAMGFDVLMVATKNRRSAKWKPLAIQLDLLLEPPASPAPAQTDDAALEAVVDANYDRLLEIMNAPAKNDGVNNDFSVLREANDAPSYNVRPETVTYQVNSRPRFTLTKSS